MELVVLFCLVCSCGHSHEHSETMKEVINMNVKLWEDLNATKDEVKNQMKLAAQTPGKLDSMGKAELSAKLTLLARKKEELSKLDGLIPEINGYEPKCNHEPGEPHTHNHIDIEGIPENDLLEIHKELRARLENIKAGKFE